MEHITSFFTACYNAATGLALIFTPREKKGFSEASSNLCHRRSVGIIMRLLLSLAGATAVAAHGSGAWISPGHENPANWQQGMRYVAEYPPHTLTMVGSDDGVTWFTAHGYCEGEGMETIHFDFSKKVHPVVSAHPHSLSATLALSVRRATRAA